MNDRRQDRQAEGRAGRDGTAPERAQSDADAVVDDRGSAGIRPVSATAKCRPHADGRMESSRNYARFATKAGIDILDGEPIERFGALGKLDERSLRFRAQELREEMYAREIQDQAKRISG